MLKMFKQRDFLIYYYIYVWVVVCANWLKCIYVCVVLKLNMNKNCKWMFSLHYTYLSIGLKCLLYMDFNSHFFIKNSSKISKLTQFTPKSSKIWVKKWQTLSKKTHWWWCFFHVVVNLNMNKLATSGGLVHGASSPFWKVAHLKNLKPWTIHWFPI